MSVQFNDRSAAAQAKAERGAIGRIEEDMLDVALELAKRPPPQGSPRDTGNNADNIGYEINPGLGEGASWRFFTRSNYGAYLELGTSRMAARPYMKPALLEANAALERTSPWK